MSTLTLVELLHHLVTSNHEIRSHNLLPSGSGFDTGAYLVTEASNDKRLVIRTSFHHMDADGHYTYWTQHVIRIYPAFAYPGFTLKVSGVNRNNIKEHIADVYYSALVQRVQFNGERGHVIG